MEQLILASASTRRAALLELADLSFTVLPSYAPEEFEENISPEEVVKILSERKALAVFENTTIEESAFILAADTIVVVDDKILNKPFNAEEAFVMLKELSGKKHKVITGVCLIHKNDKEIFCETTSVEFHKLSDDQINYYISKYHPFDKAGGYAIQEWIGVAGVKLIEGDYFNVMGLPVSRIIQKLKDMNFPFPYQG